MKKLISAVTSLAMAATMVASVAPSMAIAADASKDFSVRVIDSADVTKSSSSTTVDVSSGDVTLLCGFYLKEGTADTGAISTNFGISESCPDTSAISIAKAKTDAPTFSGKIDPEFGDFISNGTSLLTYSEDQSSAYGEGAPKLPSFTFSWVGTKEQWTGAASDTYAAAYFNVTIKKGAKSGDYKIDFYDYFADAPTNLQPYNQVVTMNQQIYSALGSGHSPLNMEGLTITVKGGDEPVATTTTTATTTKPAETTTTTKAPVTSDADIELFYAQDEYKVAPGETIDLDVMMSTKEELEVRGMYLSVLVDDGITLNSIESKSAAFGVSVDTSWTEGGDTYLKDPDFNGNKIHGAVAVGLVDGEGNGAYAKTERRVERLNVTAPTEPGTYYVNMPTTQFMYKEIDGKAVFWTVNYTPAKIVVEGGEVTTTTTPAATTTTTTTTKPVATTTTTAIEEGDHLPGDANCDGKVNIADVVRLNKAIAGKAELSAQGKINADVDYDGDQDATDSTNILKAIVKLVELHMDKAPTDIAY